MKKYMIRRFWDEFSYYDTLEEVIRKNWSLFYYDDISTICRVYTTYDHQLVPIKELEDCRWNIRKELFQRRNKKDYKFRDGPVPRTGKRKNSWRGGMRYPKTKQELSQEEVTRAKRKYLPTTWDDIWRDSERNWKSQRKTQYKS